MPLDAVILAAGVGQRLRPLTDRLPKCLIEVGGRTLIDRLLSGLAAAGVSRAVVVTGHLHQALAAHLASERPPLPVILAYNPRYATTNNAVSLAAARAVVGTHDFVLCDGDVLVATRSLAELAAAPSPGCLLVESGARLGHEEMKVRLDHDGRVLELSKDIDPRQAHGESIGVQKVADEAVAKLWRELDALLATGGEQAYYEAAFVRLIAQGITFTALPVAAGSWAEIDDLADLEAARLGFATA